MKKMMRSFTLELLEVRLWENPDVNQTCPMTDIRRPVQDRDIEISDPPLPLLQFHLTAAPAQHPHFICTPPRVCGERDLVRIGL